MPLFGPPNIEKLKAKRDVAKLIKALRHKNYTVRRSAERALCEVGDAQAVEPLLHILKDAGEDGRVRGSSADVLSKIGGALALEQLLALLRDKDEDEEVRCLSARALGNSGTTRALEPLLAVLKDVDENPRVRKWAINALGSIGDARATELLLVPLNDADKHVRKWSAEALGKIGDARAVEALLDQLHDFDSDVRMKVVEALGKIGDSRAVEPLRGALKDENIYVRRRAERALKQLGVKPGMVESQQAKLREEKVGRATPALVTGNVLAMAIVYEGHVIEEPDPVAIAKELLTGFSEAGVLTGATLHPHSGIRIQRADESAWYSGNYEPGDELPQMLNEGIGLLRDRLLAAGQTMGQVNARTVQLKGRSRVVSTCWVGMHILQ